MINNYLREDIKTSLLLLKLSRNKQLFTYYNKMAQPSILGGINNKNMLYLFFSWSTSYIIA